MKHSTDLPPVDVLPRSVAVMGLATVMLVVLVSKAQPLADPADVPPPDVPPPEATAEGNPTETAQTQKDNQEPTSRIRDSDRSGAKRVDREGAPRSTAPLRGPPWSSRLAPPQEPSNSQHPEAQAGAPADAAPRRVGSSYEEADSSTSTDDVDTPLRYSLQSIEVKGNHRTRARVILRYVPFAVGDVVDVADPMIELTRFRLLGTGFFRDVQFSLRKGSTHGSVVLVIEVVERNTVVVNDLWMGLSADADTHGQARPLTTYAGLDVAETNLAGTGMTLGGALGLAQDQFALRVRYLDPAFLATPWMISTSLLYNAAKDFFGNADVRAIPQFGRYAVVQYRRFGVVAGLGRDLSLTTQWWAHYRLESVEADPPLAASHVRGGEREPIVFDIVRGNSVLSTIRGTLQYDSRDHPFLPSQGWLGRFSGEFAAAPLGSDYEYQRVDIAASRWWPLPWGQHVAKLEMFLGAISGNAPFFEQYYVGDLSDFLPARVLGLNFDRRPSRNWLGTAIEEVRYGQYAAKVGAEYRVPLYRGHHSVYGIDLFGSGGIFALAHRRDIEAPTRAYSGAAVFPVDLTANIGVRIDTNAGGFAFSFANILGFVPVRGDW